MTVLSGNISEDLKKLKSKYDAIVVGSGAGGGLVSEKLSLSGLSVLLVEMGPYKTAKDFNLNEGEAYLSLYQDGTNRYTKDKGIKVLQGRCVGGGTTVNWTSSFRTPDLVLSHWKDHYGWSQKMIADYKNKFSYIESKFNISQWQMPPNENNHILKKGLDKLNITNNVIPRNVKDCHNLGYCGMGCPKDAKQSTLVTCVPHFLKNKGTLLHSAEVQKFVEGKSEMTITLSNGLKIKSDHLFICSGGVGSPTLLKRSSLKDDKQLVGKRTFLHPVIASSAIFEDEVLPFYGAPQSVYSDHFIENSKGCGFKLEVPPVHPVLLSSIVPFHGREHRNTLKSISNLNAIISLFRDGFHKDSVGGSVSLNEYQKPEVDYQISEYMWDSFRESLKVMCEIQFEAGAKEVAPLHAHTKMCRNLKECLNLIDSLKMEIVSMPVMSAHVMGGCLMGDDKNRSVVDLNGKLRDSERVYICDGSLFPTSLGVNPMESILTLSDLIVNNFLKGISYDT